MTKRGSAALVITVKVPASLARAVSAVCTQTEIEPYDYVAELIRRDIADRREAGWTIRHGWLGARWVAK